MQYCPQAPLPFKQHIVGHGVTVISEFLLSLNKAGDRDQQKYQANDRFHCPWENQNKSKENKKAALRKQEAALKIL